MSNKNSTSSTMANRSPLSDAPAAGSTQNVPTNRSFATMPHDVALVELGQFNDEDGPPNPFLEESSAPVSNSNQLGLTSDKGKALMARKLALASGEEELSPRQFIGSLRESMEPPGLGTSDIVDYPSSEEAYPVAGRQPTFFPVEATLVTDYDSSNHKPPVAVPVEGVLVVDQQPTEDIRSSYASCDAIRDSNHANEVRASQTDEEQTVDSVPGQQQLPWLKLHKKLICVGSTVIAGALAAVIASFVGGGESESLTMDPTEPPHNNTFPTPPPAGNNVAPIRACDQVQVNVVFNDYWKETSWDIKRVSTSGEGTVVKAYDARDHEFERTHTELICLEEGQYRFTIYDDAGDGLCCETGPGRDGYYNVTSYGTVVAQGGVFGSSETTPFNIIDPTCDGVEADVNVFFDDDPEEITWVIQKVSPSGDDTVVMTYDARKQKVETRAEHTESLCLEEGQYRFTIYDEAGDGLCCGPGHGRDGYYNVTSYGTVVAHGDDFRGSKSQTKVFNLLDPNCNRVYVNIVFDDYPGETSWDIKRVGTSGNDVEKIHGAEGGEFELTHTESMCLEEGQYRFKIYDDGGDGLCCGPGRDGYYNVTLNGTVIAWGDVFEFSETTPFNISDPTSLTSQLTNQPNTAPTTTAPSSSAVPSP